MYRRPPIFQQLPPTPPAPSTCTGSNVGLDAEELQTCFRFTRERFPEHVLEEAAWQGGCSYTTLLRVKANPVMDSSREPAEPEFVVQIRPERHAITPSIGRYAREWYADLAPEFEELDWFVPTRTIAMYQVCRMSLLPGTRLSEVLPKTSSVDVATRGRLRSVLEGLAGFHASSWE
ncbi:uncharacterized protein LTR77_010627 [Saxophila tyrrhenica]|uniref:Aminoglycoside phosphotransferase domain-containing protein n=1 Tax=Saxophila tyrrhenica TaxID=1690608 RepID=A0AAV9NUR1_9PEZI|nr:hypothetical protein LTR77_010627 [Saxophila tyrrhenica]